MGFEFRVWPAVFWALLVFCSFFKNHKKKHTKKKKPQKKKTKQGGLVYW